jgi:hypothetical protein
MVPPARRVEVGYIEAKSGRQLAYAGALIALGSSVVTIAPPTGDCPGHLAATPQPRERQVRLDLDAINFEC